MKDLKISVCIATFNGEKYIKEQILSILNQLSFNAEIIISDDKSTDKTVEIVKSFNDPRIIIIENMIGKGPVKNFENAISHATGSIIFLSDQDDIWRDDKVTKILSFFESYPEYSCLFSNAKLIDKYGKETTGRFFSEPPDINFYKLILKNRFLGCTMAFKRSVDILPFKNDLPMHDWYIGLKHVRFGKVGFINEDLIYYRRHGENVTTGKRSSILQVLKWRISILKSIFS
ncbi:glycosyltransferase family 2 protein [Sphingobacterium multivorum]|uniref:glycosyltransferase family 2 protein n=1 Tax=Sphingobacterium multivorum TaxID=28454 RepID=UPI0028A88AA9|nr:glycosyltransferase family 2 protein [Sphingobacterium multivorum]